ncbi:DUF3352 domain-containing protein [Nocardioides sp.]|uniref:DUF3352 domain-containing protein n=1 Tax=Nocardioides sp. TaxID=35761 RepID=UPI0035650C96
MSDNLPPTTPPGPTGPPPGSAPQEYLDSAAGHSFTPPAQSTSAGVLKKGIVVGGGVLGATALGVGAWAAVSFFSTGAQPAQALPDSTLAYVSIDLDPSGGQKIEALRTLNKFPAFEDEIGLDTDDDIAKEIFEQIQEESDCEGVDYDEDVAPWLGSRMAMAAVETGASEPTPVIVIQVKDADAAQSGIQAIISACAGPEDETLGWSIQGDWAVLAETEDIVDEVTEATAKGSLADDEDFQSWTGEAGSAGIVTMYAGPAAGDFLAENAADIFGSPFGGSDYACSITSSSGPLDTDDPFADDDTFTSFEDDCGPSFDGSSGETEVPDQAKQALADFKDMAGIVRFSDGAFEVEFAGDGSLPMVSAFGGGAAGEAVGSLPADTAAAVALSFADGWVEQLLDYYSASSGAGQDIETMVQEFEDETGLAVPEDIEALFGESVALSIGSDLDPEALFASPDEFDIPLGLKVKGDADEIERVLDTLLTQLPPDASEFVAVEADGDTVVIGPSADYRQLLLKDGALGDDEVFKDVVRESGKASAVFFVNLNSLEDAILEAMGEDDEVAENLKPLSGFGVTAWLDGDVAHSVLRVTTD